MKYLIVLLVFIILNPALAGDKPVQIEIGSATQELITAMIQTRRFSGLKTMVFRSMLPGGDQSLAPSATASKEAGFENAKSFIEQPARSPMGLLFGYVQAFGINKFREGDNFWKRQQTAADFWIGSYLALSQMDGISAERRALMVFALNKFWEFYDFNHPIATTEVRWKKRLEDYVTPLKLLETKIQSQLVAVGVAWPQELPTTRVSTMINGLSFNSIILSMFLFSK